MSDTAAWLASRTAAAPARLVARVEELVAAAPPGPDEPAERIGAAAHAVMRTVLAHPGDRSIALDLLAADALITLALLARAERDPATLDAFAAGLLAGAGLAA
ncbi:MAG: hypothetical protein NW201_15250 [Gemmatimonadales bacterium]|nr:hypothetical protein [Gemmatimonadales bacterium]